jgi:hypothetical protein
MLVHVLYVLKYVHLQLLLYNSSYTECCIATVLLYDPFIGVLNKNAGNTAITHYTANICTKEGKLTHSYSIHPLNIYVCT